MPIKQTMKLIILTLLVLILAACQGAPAPTSTASVLPTETQPPAVEEPSSTLAAPDAATAYPAVEEQTPAETPVVNEVPTEGYPFPDEGPGPANAPAIENHSIVTARLVSQAPDTQDDTITLLKVEVVSAEPLESSPDFTSQLAGTQVDLYATAADLPPLNPGDTFEADVSYRGDETGGKYFATQVKKVEQ